MIKHNRRKFLAFSLMAVGSSSLKLNLPFSNICFADENWIEHIRNQIPATKESVYFQTAGIAPSTTGVLNEIKNRLDYQNRGPADPQFSASLSKIEPELRKNLAMLFGAKPEEVALTHSTSEGINLAIWSVDWKPGDEVIISNQEHPANIIPWYNMRDRFGIKIREINMDTNTNLISEIKSKLSLQTKMISISHVSRNNGRTVRTDESAELAQILQKKGIRYHLDGAQGPGNVNVNFEKLGCDYYSMCGHKWLLGPKGTGACFIRKEILEDTKLTWIGSHSHDEMDYNGHYNWKKDASRFEFGTRALADFAGFDFAIKWMKQVGFTKIHTRIKELSEFAINLAQESRLKISSPVNENDRSGILVIRLPVGFSGWDIYHKLSENDRILTSPVRVESDLRIAIHFFNTKEEINKTFTAINKYCG
jgi:selenocysteine lyase/cysteine desulfurase